MTPHTARRPDRLGAQIRQRNGADVAADAIGEFVWSRQFVDS